ncbi:MAG: ornithine cyclodeaminase family protein [Armatimonadetes bacterium]|nr:ornithine cyclodeaminase family protein [Armatimonadota bacterium]
MEIIYLSRRSIEGLGMGMKAVLAAVDEGFRLKGEGRAEMPAKIGIHPAPDAFIHAMPAYIGGAESAGLKWVSGYPSNIEKGLPYITGLLILNDPRTGIPIAVMDCAWITAMRTGASVGIAAKYLARPDSRVAGVLGCGVQARTSLRALAEALPGLKTVRCCDLFPEAVERYIADLKPLLPHLDFIPCGSPGEMMEGVDVAVSAIPIVREPQPPLDAGMLSPGGLAVSLDYDAAWTGDAMAECDKFVSDDIAQLLRTREHGVHFAHIPQAIYADLGELASGQKPGRENPSERIFCMNMGIAVDDMMTARALYALAAEKGAGVQLEL